MREPSASEKSGLRATQFMKDEYPTGKSDLMAAFMVRAQALSASGGAWAMINLPSWMALKSFEDLRRDLLQDQRIVSMVHLGRGIFGSDFGSVAFVVDNARPGTARGVYRRLFEQHVDVRTVAAIEALFRDSTYRRYEVSQVDFTAIPGSPIVYWLSEKMRASFATGRPLSEVANLRQGLATADNNRFLREWWEVSRSRTAFGCSSREAAQASGARWFPYNKGGEFRKWYGNQEYVVNWENDGAEIVDFKPRSVVRNPSTYFSPSVSWSDISSGDAAFRRYPRGFIFANTGHSGFGDERVLDRVTLLLNSALARDALRILAPNMHFDVGYVGLVPLPFAFRDLPVEPLADLVATSQSDCDTSETSWGFIADLLIRRSQGEIPGQHPPADSN